MTNKRCFLIICIIFSFYTSWSQQNWTVLLSNAYDKVRAEILDSIADTRKKSEIIRTEMNRIILDKSLDRSVIVGEKDEYINEGLHKRFTKAIQPYQVNFEGDSQMIRLTNLHVELYDADKSLHRWLDLFTALEKHPGPRDYTRWIKRFNQLPITERPDPRSNSQTQNWVEGELVCDLVNVLYSSTQPRKRIKLSDFNLAFLKEKGHYLPPNDRLPIPTHEILISFPLNGQFAFTYSEPLPGIGYILPSENFRFHTELTNPDLRLHARWASTKGDINYTDAEFRYINGSFFFMLPDSLHPETVYRLEIIGLLKGLKDPSPTVEDCWDLFRDKAESKYKLSGKNIPGELKITELYFRAGKYTVEQKLKEMEGVVDWDKSAIIYETDEPHDQIELYGTNGLPPSVFFGVQSHPAFGVIGALNSNEVFYYLTVPRIEPLENIPIETMVNAELDNTLDAEFVRNVRLGNIEGYPAIPESRDHDLPLQGNYIAPAYNYQRVKDTLSTTEPVPFITKEHFTRGKQFPFHPTKCILVVGELKQLLYMAHLQQRQLGRRVNERAEFFYTLEKRRSMRIGVPMTLTIEDFLKQEEVNMPSEVKLMLESKFPDVLKKGFTVIYNRKFPGTDQLCSQLYIKPIVD